jgi:hypothetical protein
MQPIYTAIRDSDITCELRRNDVPILVSYSDRLYNTSDQQLWEVQNHAELLGSLHLEPMRDDCLVFGYTKDKKLFIHHYDDNGDDYPAEEWTATSINDPIPSVITGDDNKSFTLRSESSDSYHYGSFTFVFKRGGVIINGPDVEISVCSEQVGVSLPHEQLSIIFSRYLDELISVADFRYDVKLVIEPGKQTFEQVVAEWYRSSP